MSGQKVHRTGTAHAVNTLKRRHKRHCASAPATPTGLTVAFVKREVTNQEVWRARVNFNEVVLDVAARPLQVERYDVQLRACNASGVPISISGDADDVMRMSVNAGETLRAVFEPLPRAKTWYFQARVRVLNRIHGGMCWSAWTGWTTAVQPTTGALPGPPVPTGVALTLDKVEAVRGAPWRAKVKWNETPTWTPTDGDALDGAASYNVDLEVSNNGGTSVANLRTQSIPAYPALTTNNAQFAARTQRHYRARVQAVDILGRVGAHTAWTSWTSPGVLPNEVTGVVLTNPAPLRLRASWTPPEDISDVDFYTVRWVRATGSPWTIAEEEQVSGTRASFDIPPADRHVNYRVRVFATAAPVHLAEDPDIEVDPIDGGASAASLSAEVESTDETSTEVWGPEDLDIPAIVDAVVPEIVLPPPSDGDPPAAVTGLTLVGGMGFLFAKWTADTATTDSVTYDVHLSTSTGFTPGPTNLLLSLSGTFGFIKAMPDGTALAYGTAYYAKIVAHDVDGTAAASAQASASMVKAVTADIAANAVTVAELADNAVTQAKLADDAVGPAELAALAVTTAKLAALAVTTAKIAADAVTSGQLADDAVGTEHLQALAVTSAEVAASAITTAKIAADAVTAGEIAANAVGTSELAALAVSTAKIAADAITSAQLADDAVGNEHIQALAVNSAEIAASAITTAKIAADAVTAGEIAANAVGTSELNALAVTSAKIAALAVTTTELAADAVTAAKLADNAVGTEHIQDLAITAAEVASNAITTAKIIDDAVNQAKLAALSVGTGEIIALAVTAAQIAANTITAAKIAADTITAAEIAALAITTSELAAGAVTAAKIAADTITANEIAASAITTSELAAGSVTAAKIVADTITAAEIAALAITTSELAAGAVTAVKIAAGTITANEIAAATITGANIAGDTITATQIAANAITTSELNALAVTAAKIAANTITAAQITAGTITTTEIATDTILAGNIAASAITSSELAANSVIAGKILAGTIVAADIAAATITAAKIAANTITAAQIAAGTITAAEIAALTITAGKIAANTITAAEIAADAITTSELAANAVTAGNILAGTIVAADVAANTLTAGEIAASAITSSELAANSVIAGKILAGTIVAADIAADTITSSQIAASAITTSELAALAVTAAKIAAGTITATQIAAGTITSNEIAAGTITAFSALIAEAAIGDAFISSLSAEKIIGGTLSGEFTLEGFIAVPAASGALMPQPGVQGVIVDSLGIRVYDNTGNQTANFPSTDASPNSVTAAFVAKSLEVNDGYSYKDTDGRMEVNSGLNLQAGTQAPSNAPAVTQDMAQEATFATTLTIGASANIAAYTGHVVQYDGICYEPSGTGAVETFYAIPYVSETKVVAGTTLTQPLYLVEVTKSTGAIARVAATSLDEGFLLDVINRPDGGWSNYTDLGVVRCGNYLLVLFTYEEGGTPKTRVAAWNKTTFAWVGVSNIIDGDWTVGGYPSWITRDQETTASTAVPVVLQQQSDDDVVARKYASFAPAATYWSMGSPTTLFTAANPTALPYVWGGFFDGTDWWIGWANANGANSAFVRRYNTSGTPSTTHDWLNPGGNLYGGLAYKPTGTLIYSQTSAGTVYKAEAYEWEVTSSSPTHKVAYTWRNNSLETTVSPRATLVMKNRWRMSATVGLYPTGGTGAWTSKIFVLPGTGDPAAGAMKLQATLTGPTTTASLVAYASGGAADLTVNGLSAIGTPAFIAPGGSTSFAPLKGDGDGFMPIGAMIMWPTTTAPTGWVKCDGSSVLRAGTYAALFAVIGTTFGTVDGTHFTLPDLRARFPIGVGTFGALATADGLAEANRTPRHQHGPGSYATGAGTGTDRAVGTGAVNASDKVHLHNITGNSTQSAVGDIPFLSINFIIKF